MNTSLDLQPPVPMPTTVKYDGADWVPLSAFTVVKTELESVRMQTIMNVGIAAAEFERKCVNGETLRRILLSLESAEPVYAEQTGQSLLSDDLWAALRDMAEWGP